MKLNSVKSKYRKDDKSEVRKLRSAQPTMESRRVMTFSDRRDPVSDSEMSDEEPMDYDEDKLEELEWETFPDGSDDNHGDGFDGEFEVKVFSDIENILRKLKIEESAKPEFEAEEPVDEAKDELFCEDKMETDELSGGEELDSGADNEDAQKVPADDPEIVEAAEDDLAEVPATFTSLKDVKKRGLEDGEEESGAKKRKRDFLDID